MRGDFGFFHLKRHKVEIEKTNLHSRTIFIEELFL